jgi:hypothetical protein
MSPTTVLLKITDLIKATSKINYNKREIQMGLKKSETSRHRMGG